MNTKLTLSIKQDVISQAKKYAKDKGSSLSEMIENYLKSLTLQEDNINLDITPMIKSLKGSFQAPKNFNYKTELSKALNNKYAK
jgi:hypothetical protein